MRIRTPFALRRPSCSLWRCARAPARAHLRVHVHRDVDDARVEEDGGHEAPELVAVHDGRRPLGLRAAAPAAAATEGVWTRHGGRRSRGRAGLRTRKAAQIRVGGDVQGGTAQKPR